jgi:hypothetical protein
MIRRLSTLAVIPFFLVACDPQEDEAYYDDRDVAEERAHEIGDTETLSLGEVENSGVSGDVRFTVLGENETDVVVEVHDAQPNTSYQVAIHQGTCDNVGSQRHQLDTVETDAQGHGASSTTLNARLVSVMDGNHVVALHGARVTQDTDTDATDMDEDDMVAGDLPVACGEISEHGTGLGW